MKKIQVTLTPKQHEELEKQMEKEGITSYSTFFRRIIDKAAYEDKMLIKLDHILKNSRDTNKRARVMQEVMNYQVRTDLDRKHLIPINNQKTKIFEEAEVAVNKDIAHLREIKLNRIERKE